MTTWWMWLLAGLGLLIVEMATPGGLYFLFFAVAAFLVGVLSGMGVGPDWVLLLIFSVLATGSLLLFRGPLLRRLKSGGSPGHTVENIAGEIATLSDDLAADGTGRAELRGTVWSVRNISSQPMSKGQRCKVERVDGLTLIVRPE